MPEPMLTIYNHRGAACGIPPAISNDAAKFYVGYFENREGEQWLFTFNRVTREAILRGGNADWGRAHAERRGQVDRLTLSAEEGAWRQACWRAAAT